jgi:hypothetical protein
MLNVVAPFDSLIRFKNNIKLNRSYCATALTENTVKIEFGIFGKSECYQ